MGSEQQLADRASSADHNELLVSDLETGFVQIVSDFEDGLYSAARRLGHVPEDAADLVADALLRAWRALRTYDKDRIAVLEVGPWLVTILLNLSRNEHRNRARRGIVVEQSGREQIRKGRTKTSATDGVLDDDALCAGLDRLPENQRIAVVLRHIAGFPLGDIAAVLDCSEVTARSHVSRGLRGLRKHLDETDSENKR